MLNASRILPILLSLPVPLSNMLSRVTVVMPSFRAVSYLVPSLFIIFFSPDISSGFSSTLLRGLGLSVVVVAVLILLFVLSFVFTFMKKVVMERFNVGELVCLKGFPKTMFVVTLITGKGTVTDIVRISDDHIPYKVTVDERSLEPYLPE